MKSKELLLLWIIIPLLTSCVTTDNFRTVRMEFLQPGLLASDTINTIAIFNRVYNYSEKDTFYYKVAGKKKMVKDTLVKYKNLSVTCTDALSDYLRNSGYFTSVLNYRDSMKNPTCAEAITRRLLLQQWKGYDALIFLDHFEFYDELMAGKDYLNQGVLFDFPEFEGSTMMETVKTYLSWSIVYKNDTLKHSYKRPDNLHYGNAVNHGLFGSEENHRKLLTNTAGALGESFAAELIPNWQTAERIYYRSHNPQMLVAQKYLLSENYNSAAEIYRQLTDNKNPNIAAKASYNMALICEMEGNLVAGMYWLSRSASIFNWSHQPHYNRCTEYISTLKKRQKEIESLSKQMKDKEAPINEPQQTSK